MLPGLSGAALARSLRTAARQAVPPVSVRSRPASLRSAGPLLPFRSFRAREIVLPLNEQFAAKPHPECFSSCKVNMQVQDGYREEAFCHALPSSVSADAKMNRKRHSASEARQHEIVEEVVDNLRPWKDRKSRAAVAADVEHELNILIHIVPLGTELFDRRRNRAHAQKLNRAVSEVERLLSSAPGMLAWSLFNPLHTS